MMTLVQRVTELEAVGMCVRACTCVYVCKCRMYTFSFRWSLMIMRGVITIITLIACNMMSNYLTSAITTTTEDAWKWFALILRLDVHISSAGILLFKKFDWDKDLLRGNDTCHRSCNRYLFWSLWIVLRLNKNRSYFTGLSIVCLARWTQSGHTDRHQPVLNKFPLRQISHTKHHHTQNTQIQTITVSK